MSTGRSSNCGHEAWHAQADGGFEKIVKEIWLSFDTKKLIFRLHDDIPDMAEPDEVKHPLDL